MGADRVLTLRELNRATLARQMLLDREPLPVSDAVERLVGLQAQVPNPPYIGLWTRLRNFRRDDLTGLLQQREVVRATLMRATLHLMTAGDYLLLRPALQPALTRSLRSIAGKRLEGLDLDRVVAAARTSVEEAPRTFTELGACSPAWSQIGIHQPWPTWCARTYRSSRRHREASGARGAVRPTRSPNLGSAGRSPLRRRVCA
ncbi:MAG: winged helix DNA-binding domain-containing protein, partial [Actinobacteria bacterium]|nr:winged helix DNA-binding domain-containing protein [Actinomycetota bacterium]